MLSPLREIQRRYEQSPKGKVTARKRRLSPRGKFAHQRHRAKERGIEWLLSFDEWWKIWEPHWPHRGRASYQLVMARNGDIGPYSADNVKIITNAENVRELRARR